MATEKGIVTKIDSTTAWVKTTKTHACEGCEARASCNAMGGGKEMEVQAINYARAKVGEEVVLSFETSPLLKATFMLYVLPILLIVMFVKSKGNKMAKKDEYRPKIIKIIKQV